MRSKKPVNARKAPRWVMQSLAPWSIGACLLVSFTASAGPRIDGLEGVQRRTSMLSLNAVSLSAPEYLSLPLSRDRADSQQAQSFAAWVVKPRLDPGLNARVPDGPQPLMFVDFPELLPAIRLHSSDRFEARSLASGGAFSLQKFDGSTLQAVYGDIAPSRSSGGSSPVSLASLTATTPDGATPAILRAVSLASTTPAPIEPQVVTLPPRAVSPAVASLTAKSSNVTGTRPAAHPGYADLIDPEDMNREQRCLAEAIYFEARSESPEGQAAVAQVVLNRVKSGLYPDSVCGVVYQNRHRYMACQFSFACEGKSLKITEQSYWRQAVKIARSVTVGETYLQKVGNATHYHADYVKPSWSRLFKKTDTIGRHIFYRPKPGQG